MKKTVIQLCILLLGISGASQAIAQCHVSLTATTQCPGSVLTANAGFPIMHINWLLNGQIIKSVDTSFQQNAVTVAGGYGYGSDSNQFQNNLGIWVDSNDNVYVGDQYNNRVQKWAPSALYGTTVAQNNNGNFVLGWPAGIYVDDSSNMYISDNGLYDVIKWQAGATNGTVLSGDGSPGSALTEYSDPMGIWVDDSENTYVADEGDNRVLKWAPGATQGIVVAGGNGFGSDSNQCALPRDVQVDDSGNVYVLEYSNNRITKWAPGATHGTTVIHGAYGVAANEFSNLTAFWLDKPHGYFYILDNNRIIKWAIGDTTGVILVGGAAGAAPNQLSSPWDIMLDKAGNIFVSDQNNERVQKFSAIDDTLLATQPGTYTAVISGWNGCVDTTVNIIIGQIPPAAITTAGPTVLCVGGSSNSVTLKSNTDTGYSYQWARNGQVIGGATDSTYAVGGGIYGSFTVTVSNGMCAATSSSVGVTALPPAHVTALSPLQFCNGGNVTLQADTLSGLSWQWKKNGVDIPGQTGSAYTADTSGSYAVDVTYTGANGSCFNSSQPTIVKVKPVPQVTIASSNSCLPSTLTLSCNIPASQILWQQNGATIDTAEMTFQRNAITVAGGNGAGSANNQLGYDFRGLFVDNSNGNLYIADAYNNRIQLWTPGATSGLTVAGGNGSGSGNNQLSSPYDVFVDASGNVYAPDGNGRVQEWAPGAVSGVTVAGGNGIGAASNQMTSPYSIWVDGSQNLFVSDQAAGRVQKWMMNAPNGVTVAGGNGVGNQFNQLWSPLGLSVDDSNNIYVVEPNNDRIMEWAPGATQGTVAAQFPLGVYIDYLYDVFATGDGNIYVADADNYRVVKWKPGAATGTIVAGDVASNHSLMIQGTPGSSADMLTHIKGIFIDDSANLYVADVDNARVQKFKPYINDTLAVNVGGNYSAIVMAENGCSATTPIVNPAPTAAITPSGTVSLCSGDSITLNTPAATGYTYQWYQDGTELSGENSNTYTTSATGQYTVFVSYDTCSALSAPDTVVVHTLPQPQINVQGNTLVSAAAYVAYQWGFNGQPIPNATSSSYAPTQNGPYTLTVTDTNGCKATSAIYNFALGVVTVQPAQNDVIIYPNPATDIVRIVAHQPVDVVLSTMLGEEIMNRKDATSINVDGLADGMYMITVRDKNGLLLKTAKIVKTGK